MKLLSPAHTNAKTAKNSQFDKYLSSILHLAPFNLSGFNVCPAASKGCAMACLNTAGRGQMTSVQTARIRKTKWFYSDRIGFMAQLIKDIHSLVKKATKENKQAVVRLNGTSDIAWENIWIDETKQTNIFNLFPGVQFYDYSKRLERFKLNQLPRNYHLTFSASEVNTVIAKRVLAMGFNVAVVFRSSVPDSYWNTKVIDGVSHDLRFMESYQGCIIGLIAKGKGKADKTGFVKDVA